MSQLQKVTSQIRRAAGRHNEPSMPVAHFVGKMAERIDVLKADATALADSMHELREYDSRYHEGMGELIQRHRSTKGDE